MFGVPPSPSPHQDQPCLHFPARKRETSAGRIRVLSCAYKQHVVASECTEGPVRTHITGKRAQRCGWSDGDSSAQLQVRAAERTSRARSSSPHIIAIMLLLLSIFTYCSFLSSTEARPSCSNVELSWNIKDIFQNFTQLNPISMTLVADKVIVSRYFQSISITFCL